MADFDFSELTKLAADLGKVGDNAGPFIRQAIQVTSLKVKKAAQKSVGDSEMWSGAAAAITYDTEAKAALSGSSITSEIGYDKGRAGGKLGNLREFGAPNATYGGKKVPLAPSNDLRNALEANQDDFEHGIEKAIDDALKAVGL
ncbi:hypothetical protein [Glaciibacter psychrotolerans]|uniref:HK97 gp10 family phage protein n=1 Tax=Glaciibacter psychrotolerans TaxID=670054 RepID=A0A7Z0EDZ9_9MICO|nr:hypothetical protein [Leifsonia psychrotolerans]NYJ19199.1 hypothetical protein [Leifsonia psychrotolerans]